MKHYIGKFKVKPFSFFILALCFSFSSCAPSVSKNTNKDVKSNIDVKEERLGNDVISVILILPKGKTLDVSIQGKAKRLEPYRLAKYEVTSSLWCTVFEKAIKKGYKFSSDAFENLDDIPITNITWHDAIVWTNALSEELSKTPCYVDANGNTLKDATNEALCNLARVKKDATGYRLPQEAEWEVAARGGNPLDNDVWNYVYAGGQIIDELGWYGKNSESSLHKVGTKKSNTLALHDMSGNAWEWCFDWYNEAETARVNRGGGARSSEELCAVSQNGSNFPHVKDTTLGFRLAIAEK